MKRVYQLFTLLLISQYSLGFGFGPSPSEMSTEQRREYLKNDSTLDFAAGQIASVFSKSKGNTWGGFNDPVTSNKTKDEQVKAILSQYGLDDSNLYDIQDKVLSKAAYKLALNEVSFQVSKDNPYMLEQGEIKASKRLNEFETLLADNAITVPSNINTAYKLQEISSSTMNNHKDFLKRLEDEFSGSELTNIARDSMFTFKHTDDLQKDTLTTMAKGEIDHMYLQGIISTQLDVLYGQGPHFIEANPELLELAASYIDFAHKPGKYYDSMICSLSNSIYRQTSTFSSHMGFSLDSLEDVGCVECTMQGMTAVNQNQDTRSPEEIMRVTNQSSVNKISKLIELGADPNMLCNDGQTPLLHLNIAESEGLISLEDMNSQSPESSDTRPCQFSMIGQSIPEFCHTADVLSWAHNQFLKRDKMIKRGKVTSDKYKFISAYGDNKCNFSLISSQVKKLGKYRTEELSLRITTNHGDKEMVLSANDKKLFLDKLETVLDSK
jgi:hypothetical protein